MTDIQRRLDRVVSKELARNIIPLKTDKGILVGSILIVSEGSVKHLYKNEVCLYSNIRLNAVAIKMANALAKNQSSLQVDKLYRADQEYGKWFVDSRNLLSKYHSAIKNKDYERADTLWAKYYESRERTNTAKSAAVSLTYFV
jgi:hypothetical protein